MKSIKQRLIVSVGVLVLAVCLVLGIGSYYAASGVLESTTETNLKEIAKQSSGTISSLVSGNLKEINAIAAREDLEDTKRTPEEKVAILTKEVERIGCLRMAYIETNGESYSTNGKSQNLSDREYFTKAMAGESSVTDPSIGKSTGELLVFYGAPIKSNGQVVGVLQEIRDGNNLSSLAGEVTVGKTGFAYLINDQGTVIAHKDTDLVMDETNIIEKAKSDSSYTSWSEAVSNAIAKKKGFTTYRYGGVDYYAGFAQVEGTSWEVMVVIKKSEILSGLHTLMNQTVLISVLALIAGILVAYIIASRIARGIKASSSALELLAGGDLTISVADDLLKKKDEVGEMSRAMHHMSGSFSKAICRIKGNSSEIDEQSELLSRTSDEISQVSQNVAESITEIANGTVTQSENLNRISEILRDFGQMMSQVVQQIQDVDQASTSVSGQAMSSREEMTKINASVAKVGELFESFRQKIDALGESITSINEFTSVINQIATQTNLLALNASIEAARAGEAGRGFAVVAEEIGHLAEQSQESSENISELVKGISDETRKIIEETSTMDSELNKQSEVIRNTIDSFQEIIVSIDNVLPKINTAEETIKEVDSLKDVIVDNVDEISNVANLASNTSQDISAAAEELSASIHEMSGIADRLKNSTGDMRHSVDEFKVE